jgi:hypothetical protein
MSSSHPDLPNSFFLLGFVTKILYEFLVCLVLATCPAVSFFLIWSPLIHLVKWLNCALRCSLLIYFLVHFIDHVTMKYQLEIDHTLRFLSFSYSYCYRLTVRRHVSAFHTAIHLVPLNSFSLLSEMKTDFLTEIIQRLWSVTPSTFQSRPAL